MTHDIKLYRYEELVSFSTHNMPIQYFSSIIPRDYEAPGYYERNEVISKQLCVLAIWVDRLTIKGLSIAAKGT